MALKAHERDRTDECARGGKRRGGRILCGQWSCTLHVAWRMGTCTDEFSPVARCTPCATYSYVLQAARRTPLCQTGWGAPLPRLHRDWAHRCHACPGTGPTWFGVFIAMLRTAAAAAWRTAASGWSSARTSAPIAPAAAHLTYQPPSAVPQAGLLIPPKVSRT